MMHQRNVVCLNFPEHTEYKAEEIAALCAPDSSCYEEIAFYYYTQYHLHIQLLDAGNYAREKGIIFKGDIPIGISRNRWRHGLSRIIST